MNIIYFLSKSSLNNHVYSHRNYIVLKYIFKPLLFIFFYLCFFTKIQAQQTELKIIEKDSIQLQLFKSISYSRLHKNKNLVLNEIQLYSEKIKNLGFINNNYTIIDYDSILITSFNLGIQTKTIKVRYNSEILKIQLLKDFPHNFTDDHFELPINKVETTLKAITKFFETKGNSFVEVFLTDFEYHNNLLTATLQINQSEKRVIHKIIMKGYPEFPKKFYKNHFKFKPNLTFNINKVQEYSDLLKKIPFINEIKPPEVLFTNDSTIIYLYAQKKNQNKFNGLIGFSNEVNNSKLVFTGNLDINLSNIFNKGEEISINWKSSLNDYKLFEINFFTPYIYNTKFSPRVKFSISKQDTSYINIKTNLKLNYNINSSHSINGLFKKENSTISTSTNNTSFQDFKKYLAGISYSHISNLKNPISFEIGYLIGSKKTDSNKTQLMNLEFLGEYNFYLSQKSSFLIRQQNEIIFSNSVLENELFRIGGTNTIRGFDELAIFSSNYSITNLEYHLKLNQSSSIYSISDFGYSENKITRIKSNLYSFGIGYAINNEKSSTNLMYAVGKTDSNPLKFNNSKIHLKIVYFF